MNIRSLVACVAFAACAAQTSFVQAEEAWTGEPDYYVTYVQSTGDQYIDTGVNAAGPFKAEMEMAWDVLEEDKCFLGAMNTSPSTIRFFAPHYYSKKWALGYGADSSLASVAPTKGYRYHVEISLAKDSQTMDIDGVRVVDKTQTNDYDLNRTAYLFALNHQASVRCYSKAKCYWLKIWQGGELKRDFLPCVKNGEACLYDKVSETYFRNQTATPLVAGDGAAEDVNIFSGGTYQFESASGPHGMLRNLARNESVTLTQTDEILDADHAVKFTGFDAISDAQTRFLGGWWDFGATSDTQINFFTNTATASRAMTIFDGAVVTNVGFACIAGSSGTDNTLILTNGADFTVEKLTFGSKLSDTNSKLLMSSGSSLTCRGIASMSDYSVSYGSETASNMGRYKTGNIWEVSGTNTTLSVGGSTYIGFPQGVTGSYLGTTGGNTFKVTDGACAKLGDFRVSTGACHGSSNAVVFARGAKVTMSGFSYDTGAFTVDKGRFGANRVSILDGAVVTNTGVFNFGNSFVESSFDEFIISNATFYTDSFYGGDIMRGYKSRFVLSGPKAILAFRSAYSRPFGNGGLGGSTFVVENFATNQWRGANGGKYFSYTAACKNNTLLVRTGAYVKCPNGIGTSGYNEELSSTNNQIIVESDATLVAAVHSGITGSQGAFTVNDATANFSQNLGIGGSNCLMRVCGSHPKVTVSWNLYVNNDSCLRFELPARDYEFATSDNPLLDIGRSSGGYGLFVKTNSRLEVTGAKEFLDYHKEHDLKREYVLVRSNTTDIELPEGCLEQVQAQLPEGMKISVRPGWNCSYLVLSVKPVKGLVLIVR